MAQRNISIVDFANSGDPNKVVHNEPPCLDLHCLSSSLLILITIRQGRFFYNFTDVNFIVLFLRQLRNR